MQHEANRLKFAVQYVKSAVDSAVSWITATDREAADLAAQYIEAAYRRELACVEALVARIIQTIEQCQPICEKWLFAPDAFCVCSDLLVVPPPPPAVVPKVHEFSSERLNEEQLSVASVLVSHAHLGELVLSEDVAELLSRMKSACGPLGNIYARDNGDSGTALKAAVVNICLPKALRIANSAIDSTVWSKMDGGVISVAALVDSFSDTIAT